NDRRNDPSVDGARIPPNSAGIAPCRSRPMSSMLSAPPIIPATTQGTFSCAFTPHRRRTRTCSSTRPPRPARCASATTGTSPARDTKFGSSNVAWIFAKSCNNRTCEVSSPLGTWKSQQLPSSQFRGHLPRRRARMSHYSRGGSRLRVPGGRPLDYQQVRWHVLSGREMKTTEPGVLTVAAVPIGQPADASPRLAEALATADVIAAENTHRLRRLAAALGVTLAARIEHYQDVGEKDKADGLVTVLAGGQDVL